MHLTTSFKILGLNPDADDAQAKRAYKAQVRRWHPDQFSEGSATKAGAEEQLKQINIAYARIKEHLAARRPPAAESTDPSPQSQQGNTDHRDGSGNPSKPRSWVDHLFDTLNAFAGGRNTGPSPESDAEAHRSRPKRFDQVLNEMAGGSIPASDHRRPANPDAAARRAAAYRRQHRSGANVGAVGGTESPGPVKPVGRVRGIGRGS